MLSFTKKYINNWQENRAAPEHMLIEYYTNHAKDTDYFISSFVLVMRFTFVNML